ncbi:Riboflavin biosynthesis protein RibD [Candidatus Hodgkinia cicadicola]|nr:Riboflavin biosynthesis protein RibD [Candidatus Hodgkinia cicadicola]
MSGIGVCQYIFCANIKWLIISFGLNPRVVCVVAVRRWLVFASTCLGGKPHAEVAVLSWFTRERAEYILVSLEPCSRFGRTPPCVYFVLLFNTKLVLVLQLDKFQRLGCVLLCLFVCLGLVWERALINNFSAKSVVTCFGQIGASNRLVVCANVSGSLRLRIAVLGVSLATLRKDDSVLLARISSFNYGGVRLVFEGFKKFCLKLSCNLVVSSNCCFSVLAHANTLKQQLLETTKLHDFKLGYLVCELGCLMSRLTYNNVRTARFANVFPISEGLFLYKFYSQLIKRLFWFNSVCISV